MQTSKGMQTHTHKQANSDGANLILGIIKHLEMTMYLKINAYIKTNKSKRPQNKYTLTTLLDM